MKRLGRRQDGRGWATFPTGNIRSPVWCPKDCPIWRSQSNWPSPNARSRPISALSTPKLRPAGGLALALLVKQTGCDRERIDFRENLVRRTLFDLMSDFFYGLPFHSFQLRACYWEPLTFAANASLLQQSEQFMKTKPPRRAHLLSAAVVCLVFAQRPLLGVIQINMPQERVQRVIGIRALKSILSNVTLPITLSWSALS